MTENKPTKADLETIGDFSWSGLGIGGLAHYEEISIVPTPERIEQIERMAAIDRICSVCGGSEQFDGTMFTTCRESGKCDDCFG